MSHVVAYIDGANLHNGSKSLGWELDYNRFRVWLSDKYNVTRAYIFIGYIARHRDLYTSLQEAGFTLVFKDVVYDGKGKPKGNCDADLVIQAARDMYEKGVEKTVLVSSDGDYMSLVKLWQERSVEICILSPAQPTKCSLLLKRTGAPIAYLEDQKSILQTR